MENSGQMNLQELRIQGLLDRYLASRASKEIAGGKHLDEDSLAAFTEGMLSEREATPMIAHLVDCSFCRHVTAELIRLDLEFAPESEPARAAVREAEPSKVSEVLSGLFSRIFGPSAGAVEAYDDTKQAEEKKTNTESEEGK